MHRPVLLLARRLGLLVLLLGVVLAGPAATAATASPPAAAAVAGASPADPSRQEVLQAQREAMAYLAAVERIPDRVVARGDRAVLEYVSRAPAAARGLGDVWQVTKCVAAVTVAVASTVIVAAKILKIKKLIKAAGGVVATAKRIVKAFRKSGSLSQKAKAGFDDLGAGVVALAVTVLDIDMIRQECS